MADWAAKHPGKDSNAMPISIYGDEAKYSATYGDKFIALVLGSPLVWKQRALPNQSDFICLNLTIYVNSNIRDTIPKPKNVGFKIVI